MYAILQWNETLFGGRSRHEITLAILKASSAGIGGSHSYSVTHGHLQVHVSFLGPLYNDAL